MRISTKTGDCGTTSLLYGRRVKKDSLRIETCGTLDELNSFLGLCKNRLKESSSKKIINVIQRDLFTVGAEVACHKADFSRLKKKVDRENIDTLESFIKKFEKKKRCDKFVMPGANILSAQLDIARSVARRAERRVVTLKNRGSLKNRYLIPYLNRLSDLLFLLARSCEKRGNKAI